MELGFTGEQICDIMHEIMVRKVAIAASGDDSVFVHGCALYICMLIKEENKSRTSHNDATTANTAPNKSTLAIFICDLSHWQATK